MLSLGGFRRASLAQTRIQCEAYRAKTKPQHGRRVIKVSSSLFECAFLIISGLIRVGLPPEHKTKLKESLCRAGNRTLRKATCIIAKFGTLQLCTHTLNVHKNFVPSVHSIDWYRTTRQRHLKLWSGVSLLNVKESLPVVLFAFQPLSK